MSPEEAAAQSNAAVSRLADAKMTEEGAKLLKRQLGEDGLLLGLREVGRYSCGLQNDAGGGPAGQAPAG